MPVFQRGPIPRRRDATLPPLRRGDRDRRQLRLGTTGTGRRATRRGRASGHASPPPRLPRTRRRRAWRLDDDRGDAFSAAPRPDSRRGDRTEDAPRLSTFHPGIALPTAAGTPVGAAARGRVVFAGFDGGGYGNLVEVAHGGGVVSMYAHLAGVSVRRGQTVAAGARVGRVGSTGE